jgi:SagB-type dehydrogenase family enzyme
LASFTERYHELTKYNPHTIDKLGPVHWDSQPPAFKAISAKEKIDLLPHLKTVMSDLDAEAPGRGDTLPESLSRLLFFTLGLTARLSDAGGGEHFLRAAPSAGGLYPTEIYVAVRRGAQGAAEGPSPGDAVPDGLYHYHSLKSALIPVWQGSFWGDLKHYFLGHPAVEASNLIFLFTGTYGRSAWRYKERAYRRILLDTGHALGNLLEVCRQTGLDCSVLGSFLDDGLEELLFLTAKEEFPLLGIAVGPASGTAASGPGVTTSGPATSQPGAAAPPPSPVTAAPSPATRRLPPVLGQHPSDSPAEAIKHVLQGDAMQIQQNSCERIRTLDRLRPAVIAPCGGPAFAVPTFNAMKTIVRRRSCRKFTGASVTVDQLNEIFAFTFRKQGEAPWCLAPGRLQFHVIALSVEGLEAGVYTLDAETLALAPKRLGDFRSEAYFMCLGQELAAECAFVLVHTSDLAALAGIYGDRGYRYACLDAGQIGERINLWAVHQGLGSSGIGGYYDDQANELLELPLSHGILYITLVGTPEEE